MEHTVSTGTVMRRRRMHDFFYRPRSHCDDELQFPKRQPVATIAAATLLSSTAHDHEVRDLFYHPEPVQWQRPLRLPETRTLLRTPQRRMSEFFHHPCHGTLQGRGLLKSH